MSWSDDKKKKEREEAERKRRAQASGYTRNDDSFITNSTIWDTDKSSGCNDTSSSSPDSPSCD